eukprot:scaffold9606_cov96-Isochrysis_galbana.AAC.1
MQSNRKTSVEHASHGKSQTMDTPNLRRKVRQIAVDSSEILQNSTGILGKVEISTAIFAERPRLYLSPPTRSVMPRQDQGLPHIDLSRWRESDPAARAAIAADWDAAMSRFGAAVIVNHGLYAAQWPPFGHGWRWHLAQACQRTCCSPVARPF